MREESTSGAGGIAFYNPGGHGDLAARAYLLTFGQLSDVVAQEAKRPVGSDLVLDNGVDRRWPAPSRIYETLLHVDRPVRVAQCSPSHLCRTSTHSAVAPYLRTMLDGLG